MDFLGWMNSDLFVVSFFAVVMILISAVEWKMKLKSRQSRKCKWGEATGCIVRAQDEFDYVLPV